MNNPRKIGLFPANMGYPRPQAENKTLEILLKALKGFDYLFFFFSDPITFALRFSLVDI